MVLSREQIEAIALFYGNDPLWRKIKTHKQNSEKSKKKQKRVRKTEKKGKRS